MKAHNELIQEKVLKNAKEMILEFGLKGVNMNRLARKSGVAKATLYKIIGSKEDLVSKVTIDFFSETFGYLFDSILSKETYQNFSGKDIEELVSLAVGKMRVIQKQVFLEYPTIEQEVIKYMENYRLLIEKKFAGLQEKGEITKEISPANVYRFFRMLYMQMVISSYSDEEVKNQLIEMYCIFFRGLKV